MSSDIKVGKFKNDGSKDFELEIEINNTKVTFNLPIGAEFKVETSILNSVNFKSAVEQKGSEKEFIIKKISDYTI